MWNGATPILSPNPINAATNTNVASGPASAIGTSRNVPDSSRRPATATKMRRVLASPKARKTNAAEKIRPDWPWAWRIIPYEARVIVSHPTRKRRKLDDATRSAIDPSVSV